MLEHDIFGRNGRIGLEFEDPVSIRALLIQECACSALDAIFERWQAAVVHAGCPIGVNFRIVARMEGHSAPSRYDPQSGIRARLQGRPALRQNAKSVLAPYGLRSA